MKDKHFYTIIGVLIVLTLIDIFVKVRVTITRPVQYVPYACEGVDIDAALRSGGLEIIQ